MIFRQPLFHQIKELQMFFLKIIIPTDYFSLTVC